MVRFKNRYVLGKISWIDDKSLLLMDAGSSIGVKGITAYDIHREVRDQIILCFGQFGFSTVQQSMQVKYWNEATGTCIFRVARDQVQTLTTSLLHIKSIKGIYCVWATVHIGGTIRSCQKQLYLLDKEKINMIEEDDDVIAAPMEV